jgi:hypothetical protein
MSTLWTPGGERPIRREPPADADIPPEEELSEEEVQARMAELREQLARTPAEVVIANHALGLFELARLHLSLAPPQLDQASLAIDALAAVVERLGDRLGAAAPELAEGLAQLRMAFVRIHAAQEGESGGGEAGAGDGH